MRRRTGAQRTRGAGRLGVQVEQTLAAQVLQVAGAVRVDGRQGLGLLAQQELGAQQRGGVAPGLGRGVGGLVVAGEGGAGLRGLGGLRQGGVQQLLLADLQTRNGQHGLVHRVLGVPEEPVGGLVVQGGPERGAPQRVGLRGRPVDLGRLGR